ncbi:MULTISPECIES: hypothetical protein [Mesorhizobium]|nr:MULTISPECIES: hypothetical protein [Mesorhizobium]QKC72175.1 hypothetical protein EB815_25735 [Mesorhizobium loti]QKC91051.1 hypothetical protein EB230_23565 [Mesorhizobium sp. NZP2234]
MDIHGDAGGIGFSVSNALVGAYPKFTIVSRPPCKKRVPSRQMILLDISGKAGKMTALKALTSVTILASACMGISSAEIVYADEPAHNPVISDHWACGSRIEVSPEIVASFHPTYVHPAKDKLPAFVGGFVKDMENGGVYSTIFVKEADAWKAFAVQEQASFSNIYVHAETGRAIFFSMISVEGPGQSYQVLSTRDGFATVKCGEVPAPKTKLDTLDYMQIRSVLLDAAGDGSLDGIVHFSEERKPECFTASSKDGGLNWSAPAKTDQCIDSVVEVLAPFDEGSGPVQDLRSLAR